MLTRLFEIFPPFMQYATRAVLLFIEEEFEINFWMKYQDILFLIKIITTDHKENI